MEIHSASADSIHLPIKLGDPNRQVLLHPTLLSGAMKGIKITDVTSPNASPRTVRDMIELDIPHSDVTVKIPSQQTMELNSELAAHLVQMPPPQEVTSERLHSSTSDHTITQIKENDFDTSETCSSVLDDDDWKSVSSNDNNKNDTWKTVSADAALQQELIDLAHQLSEDKPVKGMSLYVKNAREKGALPALIQDFERCDNHTVQVYREGNHEFAIQWAALAKDAQESIHYSTQAHQTIFKNLENPEADPLITSYAAIARVINERVQSRASLLEQKRQPSFLEQQADDLMTQAIDAHKQSIQYFNKKNRTDSKRWESIALRFRLAARSLGESAECERQAQIAQRRGDESMGKWFHHEGEKNQGGPTKT